MNALITPNLIMLNAQCHAIPTFSSKSVKP